MIVTNSRRRSELIVCTKTFFNLLSLENSQTFDLTMTVYPSQTFRAREGNMYVPYRQRLTRTFIQTEIVFALFARLDVIRINSDLPHGSPRAHKCFNSGNHDIAGVFNNQFAIFCANYYLHSGFPVGAKHLLPIYVGSEHSTKNSSNSAQYRHHAPNIPSRAEELSTLSSAAHRDGKNISVGSLAEISFHISKLDRQRSKYPAHNFHILIYTPIVSANRPWVRQSAEFLSNRIRAAEWLHFRQEKSSSAPQSLTRQSTVISRSPICGVIDSVFSLKSRSRVFGLNIQYATMEPCVLKVYRPTGQLVAQCEVYVTSVSVEIFIYPCQLIPEVRGKKALPSHFAQNFSYCRLQRIKFNTENRQCFPP